MAITIADVEWVVCAKFRLDRAKLHSGRPRDCKGISRPRQIAMFLARELTGSSYPKIGRYFGRDHTTALWAHRRIQALSETNPKIAAYVQECRSALSTRSVDRFSDEKVWAERLKQGIVSWSQTALDRRQAAD